MEQLVDILVHHGDPKHRLSREEALERVQQVTHTKKGLVNLQTLMDMYFD